MIPVQLAGWNCEKFLFHNFECISSICYSLKDFNYNKWIHYYCPWNIFLCDCNSGVNHYNIILVLFFLHSHFHWKDLFIPIGLFRYDLLHFSPKSKFLNLPSYNHMFLFGFKLMWQKWSNETKMLTLVVGDRNIETFEIETFSGARC